MTRHAEPADPRIESLADVQRLLLPDDPSIPGLRYAVHYQPAEVAAGDYYDLMALPDAEATAPSAAAVPWGVILGDVSGHGPAAAMEAVQFDAILRTYRGDEPPLGPAGALTYANRYFFSRRPRRHFMTVFAALGRPGARALDYVCAGHPPALRRRGRSVERLGDGDHGEIPLGVDRGHRYANVGCAFAPGDLLLICTDGILEARGADGRMFGLERLERVLREAPPAPAAVVDALRAELFAHQGGAIGADDQTLLVLQQTA